jgi:hypothetical protein
MSRNRKLDRYRVFVRAARAWQAGYPHQAWEIVQRAGLGQHWPRLMAALLADARGHYKTTMGRFV